MRELLFDENLEPFEGQKPYRMPLYEYFARTRVPQLDPLRSYWQSVYERMHLTFQSKTELRNNFRSNRNENCLGALFELFLYELFDAEGCVVTGPRHKGAFNPDFFVQMPNGYSVHVEATCVMCDYDASVEAKRRERIMDTINSIASDHFKVTVTIRGQSEGDPKTGRVKQDIEQWLSSLDYSEVLEAQRRSGWMVISETVFPERGLKLYVRPIAKDPVCPQSSSDLVIVSSISGAHLVITDRFLRHKLRNKAKQVNKGPGSAILALNLFEQSVEENDIMSVLFGKPHYEADTQGGHPMVKVSSREAGGIWFSNGRAINKKISALMVFTNVGFDAMPSTKPRLILNPFAVERVAFPSFPWLDTLEPDPKGDKLIPTADDNLNGQHWHESWPLPRNLVVYPLANGRQAETPDGT